MRKGTKLLVTASVFAVAVNMNGCGVYGPPPEDYEYIPSTATPAIMEEHIPTKIPEEEKFQPMEWYGMMFGRYAVIRFVSVPEVNQEDGEPTDDIVCGVEVLSWYDGDGDEYDYENITEITIWRGEDISAFPEGTVIFASLMYSKRPDGTRRYWLEPGLDGRIYTPFVENRLVLIDAFQEEPLYWWLSGYNEQIEKYRSATKKGEEFYMEFDFRTFEEGMTTEETALFFEDLKKAKVDYEEVLRNYNEEMKGAENE